MNKKVLISGASIAGLTLGYWLNYYGYKVSIVEISKGLRKGGTPIDVRGGAVAIAEKMGILKAIKELECRSVMELVDAKNETIVDFSINNQPEYKGDIEISRDDLVNILYEQLPKEDIKFY